MDWNPSGENRIPLPEGVGLGKLALYPIIQIFERDPPNCRGCDLCERNLDQMRLLQRLFALPDVSATLQAGEPRVKPARTIKVPEGATEIVVNGEDLPLPDGLLITGIAVYHKPASMMVRKLGTKKAMQYHKDPNHPYTHPRWTDKPIYEFVLAGGMEGAELAVAEHNAKLRENHARNSDHPAHADMEVIRG